MNWRYRGANSRKREKHSYFLTVRLLLLLISLTRTPTVVKKHPSHGILGNAEEEKRAETQKAGRPEVSALPSVPGHQLGQSQPLEKNRDTPHDFSIRLRLYVRRWYAILHSQHAGGWISSRSHSTPKSNERFCTKKIACFFLGLLSTFNPHITVMWKNYINIVLYMHIMILFVVLPFIYADLNIKAIVLIEREFSKNRNRYENLYITH